MEWAAPEGADWTSEETWRQAHPYWSPQRLDYLRMQYEVAPPEDFQSQYLCIPQVRSKKSDSKALASAERIHEARRNGVQPSGHVVGAVEDYHGEHTGAALCWLDDDGHPVVVGKRFGRLEEGFAWLAQYANEVLVGMTYRDHPQAQLMGAKGVGSRETNKALPLLRRLFNEHRIGWDGDDLGDQLTAFGVVERDGLLKPVAGPSYIIRPAAWAVLQQQTAPAVAATVY